MFTAQVNLRSLTPISFSKATVSEKEENETHKEHEERVWKEKLHVDNKGRVILPKSMFKKAIEIGADLKGEKIQGNEKYKKHFISGVHVVGADVVLAKNDKDIEGETWFVPSDGRKGGSTRVHKIFPVIHEWGGAFVVVVTSDRIDRKEFEDTLDYAGVNVGFGRFRPANGGDKGMFVVEKIKFTDGLDTKVFNGGNGNKRRSLL